MQCTVVKTQTKRFWIGGSIATLLVMTLGFMFQERYKVAVDTQAIPCIDARVILVDKKDITPIKGKLVAFRAPKNVTPVYPEGTLMAKILVAGPGDTVAINVNEEILVNGVVKAQGLPHLQIGTAENRKRFIGKKTLGANEYWVLGTHEWSFDSRYWGAIEAKSIVGRGYVVW